MKRLLDYDADSKIATWYHKNESDGTITIQELQDVDPILERNKAVQNMEPGGALGLTAYSRQGIKAGWWHVGQIPMTLAFKWLNEEGINIFKRSDWERVRRKLNDPDFRLLRTGLGRV